MQTDTHMTITDRMNDGYNTLMMKYAIGALDEAQSLVVASHLSISDKGHDLLKAYEALGGYHVEHECDPVSMDDVSLQSVLNRLDDSPKRAEAIRSEFSHNNYNHIDKNLPDTIKQAIQSCGKNKASRGWKSIYPGFQSMDLHLNCNKSSARFLQAEPGVKSPNHTHGGLEITLVLDGAFHDETGSYTRGDLIVTDEFCDHMPVACPDNGCLCLVASDAPIKLKGIASMLNPFLKK
jgi:putative transcriptional regulator